MPPFAGSHHTLTNLEMNPWMLKSPDIAEDARLPPIGTSPTTGAVLELTTLPPPHDPGAGTANIGAPGLSIFVTRLSLL